MATNAEICDTVNRYVDAVNSYSVPSRNDIIDLAFQNIQSDRQRFCLNDVAITAAEHYLFARWVVGAYFITIWPFCAIAFPGYDLIKGVLGDKIAASKCPVSSYDYHHTLWKEYGCTAGSYDYWFPNDRPLGQLSM